MSEPTSKNTEEIKHASVPSQSPDLSKITIERGFFYYFFRQRQTITSLFALTLFIIAIVVIVSMPGLFIYGFGISESTYFRMQVIVIIYGVIIFLFTIYRGILTYLNDNFKETKLKAGSKFATTEFSEIDKDARSITITQNTMLLLTNEEKAEMFATMHNEISQDLKKFLSDRIEIEPDKYRYEQIKTSFGNLQERIKKEISSLNNKANVNLSIGVVTTILAVGFLISINFNTTKDFINWEQFLFYYLPKISLAIFIELFSFYFLSIYKANLGEIKYYQNELSDIDFKIMSIQTVLLTHNQPIDEMYKILMSFDRNKIIKDGELTIDLKRIQIENENLKEFTNKIPNIKDYLEYVKNSISGKSKEDKN